MSPCDTCHGGCCRAFAIPITGADILRIQQDLKLSFWDFACRWADPEGIIANKYAPHFHFADEPDTPFVIALKHEQSHFLPGTDKCRFLMETPADENSPLGLGRCGIYESRPAACRAFPTKFNDSGELAVIYDIPSTPRDDVDIAYELCSREWKPEDVNPTTTIQNLVVARYEMNYFHHIAEAWNQSVGDWEVLPDYLNLIYSRRVLLESDLQGEEPVTIPFPANAIQSSSKAA